MKRVLLFTQSLFILFFYGCLFLQEETNKLSLEKNVIPSAVLPTESIKSEKSVCYAGFRRSSYGLAEKNKDDFWWAVHAKKIADSLSTLKPVEPTIIQIVSIYLDDGTTRFEFTKPENCSVSEENVTFRPGSIDHERALTTYDEQGVKAIIQFEPGNADIVACMEIAHMKFGHHPCIIGYGIDAEWYYTKKSFSKRGTPLRDEDVKKWMGKLLSFNPNYILFLKHWKPDHMPPAYRHPNLCFLSDSQGFYSFKEMMDDFMTWSINGKDYISGYQYGYQADQRWWKKMESPMMQISQTILREIPNTRFLFWVDFTANQI